MKANLNELRLELLCRVSVILNAWSRYPFLECLILISISWMLDLDIHFLNAWSRYPFLECLIWISISWMLNLDIRFLNVWSRYPFLNGWSRYPFWAFLNLKDIHYLKISYQGMKTMGYRSKRDLINPYVCVWLRPMVMILTCV